MSARHHPPAMAFVVGVLGIALFSAMDAVMKGLVLAIGAYTTMFWRNLAGIGMSGVLYLPKRQGWPAWPTMRIHIARGVLSTAMGFLFFWGLGRVPLAQAIALAFIAPLIALYLAAVCVLPEILIAYAGTPFYFGGTSLLIVVSVTMDTVAQVQSHLLAHQYEGLIKRAKLRGARRQ